MKIVGIIPARYKSSRFPGKPLADIHGKPMVARVHERAKSVTEFQEVYVATDDEQIEAACSDLGIATVMTRPDHPTGTDRLAEVATRVPADLYVNIQGDEPMVRPSSIVAAIAPFLESKKLDYEVTNLMTPIVRSPDIIDSTVPKVVVNDDGYAVYLSRSPIPYPKDNHGYVYRRQVCVYGFTPSALAAFATLKPGPSERAEGIELLRFIEHGIPVKFIEVDDDSVAVDTPSDLETVRRMWTEQR